MQWVKNCVYSLILLVAGWLFNFIFDIQFALGLVAGWLIREGFDNLANTLLRLVH